MNSDTQQIIMENKKPRMYISFWWMLLWSVGVMFAVIIGGLSSNKIYHPLSANLGQAFTMMFLSLFLVILVVFILGALGFLMKPRGYIYTKFANGLIILTCCIQLLFPFLIPRLVTVETPLWMFMYFVVPFIAMSSIAIFINHKFQKLESELMIKQPR